MSFSTLYRLSFYLMLVFATLTLNVDASDYKLSTLYPTAVALASVVAFVTIDRKPGRGLSRPVSNMLGFVALAMMGVEYAFDRNLLLMALGHWLVYLQIVYIFRAKSVENDWWMFGLGLWQVLVGIVISQSDTVGLMLFCWAILALWVLGLFSLQRDAGRAVKTRETPPSDPYPGLLNAAFLLSAFRVTLTTLALGGVIFLAMPRRTAGTRAPRGNSPTQHLTGFDDEVQLGQMGEILESDNLVMSVEFYDEADNRIEVAGEPLWRGVTLPKYETGRWYRDVRTVTGGASIGLLPDAAVPVAPGPKSAPVRQMIKLEPNDSSVLFGMRPMIEVSATPRRLIPQFEKRDGTLFRSDVRQGAFDYEVRSYLDNSLPQAGETPLAPFRKFHLLKEIPEGLRKDLRSIALGVIERSVPLDERDDPKKRAQALEAYLRDTGEFSYTLKLDVTDRTIDPVLDFLINRKEGHCEYFASALTLLLRSVDIPARMVNGFKGGDWNNLARVMSVRQKHAHSWVEAYLGETSPPGPLPVWLTLDPTPGNERQQSVASVGGFSGNFRMVTDAIRYAWVFYVVGYNADRQNKLLYGPMRQLVSEAQRGFKIIGETLKTAYARLVALLTFRTARSFFSVRGFMVSFAGLLLLSGVGWAIGKLLGRFFRRFGTGDDFDSLSAGATHYRRLAQLMAEHGIERPAGETQVEFARRATDYLASRGASTDVVAAVPKLVVDAFYLVRFGGRELSADDLASLDTNLNALESKLRAAEA